MTRHIKRGGNIWIRIFPDKPITKKPLEVRMGKGKGVKDMLIVGGYKVFSVELEDKLCSLPQIASCAVIGTPDERRPGNDVVNLFVELAEAFKQSNPDQLAQQITLFCRANMAAFKVPKKIHFIDAIPLTAVGKIDKKSLRRLG